MLTLAVSLGLLLASNGLLNLGRTRPFLASLISGSPQSVNVDYRRAWFLWPTLVHVRHLKVSGSDANVQWQVRIDEARASIDLTALLRREFHVTKLQAAGIGFRLRRKINAGAATSDRIAPLPPIPGIDGPPIKVEGPTEPDISDSKYNLWSVRIENVQGLARQVWVDEFRFEGDAQIAGAFYLRPARWLWVGPATATVLSGDVLLGNQKLLVRTSGSIGCTVPPVDPRIPNDMEFFRLISGAVRLDAFIPSARALDYYSRIRGSAAVFDGGQGIFHIDGTLRSGVAHPLNISVGMTDVTAKREAWLALGSLSVSVTTDAKGPTKWQARIAPFELQHAADKSAFVHGSELRIHAITDMIDVSRPAPAADVNVDLPSAQVPSLQVINALLSSSSKVHLDGGTASIAAKFVANTGTNRAKGALAIAARNFSAHDQDFHFGGRINLDVHVASVLLSSGDLDVSSSRIDARKVFLRDSNAAVSDWWGRVQTHDARFRPRQRVPFDMTWTAQFKNATPILAFSKRTPSVPGWISRLLVGGAVEASGHLEAGKSFFELSHVKARSGLLRVEGDLRERGKAQAGAFDVSAGPLSVGIEIGNDETNVILMGNAVEPPLKAPAKPDSEAPRTH